MRQRGFDYPTSDYQSLPDELYLERPFGVWDLDEARSRGYNGPEFPSADDPLSAHIAALTSAERSVYLSALNGLGDPANAQFTDGTAATGSGGCLQQAIEEIFVDYERYKIVRQEVQQLVVEAEAAATSDSRVRTSLQRWRDCMRSAGFDVDDPISAATGSGDVPTASEIAMAVTDVECKDKAQLMRAWYSSKREAELRLVEEHAGLIQELSEFRSLETTG